MKIGFTGTRNGMTQRQKDEVEAIISDDPDTEFHHGDCIGADEEAHEIAVGCGIFSPVIHPPTAPNLRAWCMSENILPPREYMQRNRAIVDQTDLLVAAPDGPEKPRSGTWATIRYARSKGKTVIVVYPDGTTL